MADGGCWTGKGVMSGASGEKWLSTAGGMDVRPRNIF